MLRPRYANHMRSASPTNIPASPMFHAFPRSLEPESQREANHTVTIPAGRRVHPLSQVIRSNREELCDWNPDAGLEAVLSEVAPGSETVGAEDDEKLIVDDQHWGALPAKRQ